MQERSSPDNVAHVAHRERLEGGVAIAIAVSLAVGCSAGETQRHFEDLSGATFYRTCDDGDCRVEVRASSCGEEAALVGGKWLSVCTGDRAIYAENCRLVAAERPKLALGWHRFLRYAGR